MTWLRRPEDLVIATLDGRRAGELLAHPCGCGNHNGTAHSIGEHLWDSTRNMTPGIKAASYEARGSSTDETTGPTQPGTDDHQTYRDLVIAWRNAALDLSAFIEKRRPDRQLAAVPEPSSDDNWCRACLTAGHCQPRFRDTPLCRWCTEFRLAYRMDPPAPLLTIRHERGRVTQRDVDLAVMEQRKQQRAQRRKRTA